MGPGPSDRNGIPRMSVMRAMTGIDLRRVRTGHQLQDLADLGGCCASELSALHYKKLPARSVEIRGEILRHPSDVLIQGRRLCVRCLDEDCYHRFWWDLSMVATCPKHSLGLTETCSCGTLLSWGDGAIAKCADCADGDARGAQPQPARVEDVALDRWILSRFGVTQVSEPEMLSGLPITRALEIIERVAALGLAQDPSRVQFLPRSRRSMWVRGYKCIAEGRVPEALDQAYRLSRG
ncbi:TniQ family protein [Hansschlegelia beijingensis]|uniref:TniQ family protein n=1 Tax=Hansschlegelia beijingensis TaxID=1133344 RepID=UPI00387F101B